MFLLTRNLALFSFVKGSQVARRNVLCYFSSDVILCLTKLPSETKDPLRVQPHVRKCFEVSLICPPHLSLIMSVDHPSSSSNNRLLSLSFPPSLGQVLFTPHLTRIPGHRPPWLSSGQVWQPGYCGDGLRTGDLFVYKYRRHGWCQFNSLMPKSSPSSSSWQVSSLRSLRSGRGGHLHLNHLPDRCEGNGGEMAAAGGETNDQVSPRYDREGHVALLLHAYN